MVWGSAGVWGSGQEGTGRWDLGRAGGHREVGFGQGRALGGRAGGYREVGLGSPGEGVCGGRRWGISGGVGTAAGSFLSGSARSWGCLAGEAHGGVVIWAG